MVDVIAAQIPDVPRKAARKQALAALATMMGTLVLARVAGNSEFSDEILAAGRDAALDRDSSAKSGQKRPAARKTVAKTVAKTAAKAVAKPPAKTATAARY
jgi:TetR/AcrR family transcriptional repressor of nem operon